MAKTENVFIITYKIFKKFVFIIASSFRMLAISIGKPLYWFVAGFSIVVLLLLARFNPLTFVKLLFSAKSQRRERKRISTPKDDKITIGFKTSWFIAIFIISSVILIIWIYIFSDLPSAKLLTQRSPEISTKIYDRNGILLYSIYKNKNRSLIHLADLPSHVVLATLAAEDAEFYKHNGFSAKSMLRALSKNIKEDRLTGGSTITQQLVKNTLLTPQKNIIRKIKELVLSVQVETIYSKNDILEMYLNEVPYGGVAYGIQEASRIYFDKDAKDLSISQAALLAGLPKSPTSYSPFGSNPENTFDRQRQILWLMHINKFITDSEYKNALDEKITFAPNTTHIRAPHFVMYVRDILENTYSKEFVETGGLSVITTLDYSIQNIVENAVEDELSGLGALNVTNAAVVVTNPKTGEILAMVGSRDYFDSLNDGNVNVATRLRQPGSSIKVVNYAAALSSGKYTSASVIGDFPISFAIPGQPNYSPKNYDGNFRGFVSLRSALAESRNIPAVKVLNEIGVEKMIEFGKKMGITTWNDPSQYGLSLTLGGGSVKLTDIARVYGTLASGGNDNGLISILKVLNYRNSTLQNGDCMLKRDIDSSENQPHILSNLTLFPFNNYSQDSNKPNGASESGNKKNDCKSDPAIDPRVAFIITNILSDNKARTPAFGSNSKLIIKDHPEVAVKTGTSNDLRDNLAIGYNQDYLVATWVGNNDNSPMSRVASGVTGATPIWHTIMTMLLQNKKSIPWSVPSGVVELPFCKLTGGVPCNGCATGRDFFLEEFPPYGSCNMDLIKSIQEKQIQGNILNEAATVAR